MLAALLALLSSVCWGTGDFLGGAMSRRLPTVAVLVWSQLASLVIVAVALAAGGWHPPGAYLGWGVASGVAGTVGLALFYRALATGRMSIVAPVTGSSLVVPVVIAIVAGERPSRWQVAGIVLAAAGVVLASGPELRGEATSRRPVAYAVLAALGFGLSLTFTAEGADTSTPMTLGALFATGLVLVAAWIAVRRPASIVVPGGIARAGVVAIGALNLAAAGLYAVASRSELVAVTAVLASLYPVVTVLLAWRVYDERLRGIQLAGVVAALGGVVLLGAG